MQPVGYNLTHPPLPVAAGQFLANRTNATGTRFMFEDSSLCFINCHLAAGQTYTAHRNNDVATVLEAEPLPTERDPDIRASLCVGGVELTVNVLIIH